MNASASEYHAPEGLRGEEASRRAGTTASPDTGKGGRASRRAGTIASPRTGKGGRASRRAGTTASPGGWPRRQASVRALSWSRLVPRGRLAFAGRSAFITACCHIFMLTTIHADEPARSRPGVLRFEVRLKAGERVPSSWPAGGRLMVVLATPGTREPRLDIGRDRHGSGPGARPRRRRPRARRRGDPRRPLGLLPPGPARPAPARNLRRAGRPAPQSRPEPRQRARRPVRAGEDRCGSTRPPGASSSWSCPAPARGDAAARHRAGQAHQDPLAAPERSSTAGRSTSAPGDPAPRLRAASRPPIPGPRPHRRLRLAVHRGRST